MPSTRIKKPPFKPINKNITLNLDIGESKTLSDIINVCLEKGLHPHDLKIQWGYSGFHFTYLGPQWSDEQYDEEIVYYEKQLAEYKVWRSKNIDKIALHKQASEDLAAKKRQKKLDAAEKDLEKARVRLKKLKDQAKC